MSNKNLPSEKTKYVRPRMLLSAEVEKRLQEDAARSHRKLYEQITWIVEQYYKGGEKEERTYG